MLFLLFYLSTCPLMGEKKEVVLFKKSDTYLFPVYN